MLKTAIVEDDESYREELSSYVKRYAAESGQDIPFTGTDPRS